MYKIVINRGGNSESVLRFTGKEEAMAAWDRHVDFAIPGDTLKLYKGDEIISQYSPVG